MAARRTREHGHWVGTGRVPLPPRFRRPLAENAYIESFTGRFRDECFNELWFVTIDYAQRLIERWRIEYNTERPHNSRGKRTPEGNAQRLARTVTTTASSSGLYLRTGLERCVWSSLLSEYVQSRPSSNRTGVEGLTARRLAERRGTPAARQGRKATVLPASGTKAGFPKQSPSNWATCHRVHVSGPASQFHGCAPR